MSARPIAAAGPAHAGTPAAGLSDSGTSATVLRALEIFERDRDEFLADLVGFCRVAAVSAVSPASEDQRISASLAAALADRCGLENVAVAEVDGSHPFVTAEWNHSPGCPTLLLYGHYDVQPFGDPALWTTPPTSPEIRDGRLYARGAADDKGGVTAMLAAIACYRRAGLPLPCNVRLLLDGEEEIGSPNLAAFLASRPELTGADAVVVVDTPNLAAGRPALTRSLRGMAAVDVEVRCLEAALHSGRGAGLVPDPIQILCELIVRLRGLSGPLPIPGPRDSTPRSRATPPFDFERYRAHAGLLPGVRLTGDPAVPPLERLWFEPALTVIAFEAPRLAEAANQIVPAARARLSLRTSPDADPVLAGEALVRRITGTPPHGAEVRARVVATSTGWREAPGSEFETAALESLERGYGAAATTIGAGGSIGFVSEIARAIPRAPCLLLGLEDPDCRAHAPDESLHLGDWERSIRSLIHLFDRLASIHRARGGREDQPCRAAS